MNLTNSVNTRFATNVQFMIKDSSKYASTGARGLNSPTQAWR
jgi:hypothetical protein